MAPIITPTELAEVKRLAEKWDSGHGVLVLRAVAEVKRLQNVTEKVASMCIGFGPEPEFRKAILRVLGMEHGPDSITAAKARKFLREAVYGLRAEGMAMTPDEVRSQPGIRKNLRLADRIERYLEEDL